MAKTNNVDIHIDPPVDVLRYWERREDGQEVIGILVALEVDASKLTDEQFDELKACKSDSKQFIDWLYKTGKWHVMEQGVESWHKKWKDINEDHYVKELYNRTHKDRIPIWYNKIFLTFILLSMGMLTGAQAGIFWYGVMIGDWFKIIWNGVMFFWDLWCMSRVLEGIKWFWYRRGFKKK